jgi:hypothetical protein
MRLAMTVIGRYQHVHHAARASSPEGKTFRGIVWIDKQEIPLDNRKKVAIIKRKTGPTEQLEAQVGGTK